nr:hypothetical protein [uncultured Mucilaginibacter sp.]
MKIKELKISTIIITGVFVLMVLGVFASNLVLKNVYNKIDKSDLYWNYNHVLEQPFKHLKIDGGNITNIAFEQNKKSSVRVLSDWREYKKDVTFTTHVSNDTLYINFPKDDKSPGERSWMGRLTLVRIFAPQLLSINGTNTKLLLQGLDQPQININVGGKSRIAIESINRTINSININQSDSSQVLFNISPELTGSKNIHFKNVSATLKDYTLLDIGHGYADKTNLSIADSSAIILSGKSLKAMR